MESVFTLIDQAAAKCGSRYKLAQTLDESLSFLGKIASGKKPMPPNLAARMAVIAGVDARQAALTALVSQEKNAEVRRELADALGVTVLYPVTDDSGPTMKQTIV